MEAQRVRILLSSKWSGVEDSLGEVVFALISQGLDQVQILGHWHPISSKPCHVHAAWNLQEDNCVMSLSFVPCKLAQDLFAALPCLESGWVLTK